jgi:PKD repeat protein
LSIALAVLSLAGVTLLAPAAQAVPGQLSFVGAASTAGNRSSHNVRIPATVQAGDLLVLFMTTNDTAPTIANPAGWTVLESRDGNGTRGRVWTRTATAANAGANLILTTSAATKSSLAVAAYRSTAGPATVTADASSARNTSATAHPAPAVDVRDEGSWLVNLWSEKSSTAVTWAVPTGTTQRTVTTQTGTGKVTSVLGDSGAAVAVGNAPGRTATTSAAVGRDLLFSVVVSPGDDGTTPPNQPPTAAFTFNCSGLACSFDGSGSTDPDADPLTYTWDFGGGATGTGVRPTYGFAGTGSYPVKLTVSDGTSAVEATNTVNVTAPASAGNQPVPGHGTRIAPQIPQRNMPRITAGEIWDIEVVGTKVYVAGGFTSAQNAATGNTSTVAQANLLKFDLGTGLIDTTFRPTFGGGGVTDVEASPDGTKLYVAGRFNTINGVTKRKFASISPTTGAAVTTFTADANGAGTELEASNTTVYVGGQFTTINGVAKSALAAVNAETGALVGRTGANPGGTFNNDITGGIGVNGQLNVQELKLTHDGTKLMVIHTGRQIAGQNRYGVGLINTASQQLLPWRSRLWEDNLAFVGGIQRAYAGDIAPDDSYLLVTSGSGGDRPPINDTIIRLPLTGGDDVQPEWISRAFDSVYSIAASESAIYIGGHFSWNESPTAKDPWPGLDDVGYGTGQGLSGYSLGDDVVRRDHIGAISPVDGKAVEWDPGSNSFEGNKAMIAIPRGVITGGDATTQGAYNVGRIAFYDFNSVAAPGANETTITTPIQGRVEEAAVPFTVEGTATATSGVNRVELEVISGSRYLQDDLTTWGASNSINVTLANPRATSTTWSQELTITGNRTVTLQARTVGVNNSSDATKAVKKIETFSTADKTPSASISSPGGSLTTTTFILAGTATDDVGVQSIGYTIRDTATSRYLQNDGSAAAAYNSFRLQPDVPGALSTTFSTEITVPYQGEWQIQLTPTDTAGQSSLDSIDRTITIGEPGVEPTVTITAPVAMTPPTGVNAITLAPGSPLTFSGTAADDESLRNVEISLRNSTTRENLAADGNWGVDYQSGWYPVTATDVQGDSVNWSYTTPFNLKQGTYSFSVRATDDDMNSTSSTFQGRLTINVQVTGDAPPNGLLTALNPAPTTLSFTLNGTATDDKGVAEVRVALEDNDTNKYLQPNGTMAVNYATVPATLETPGGTSTAWTLPVTLPTQGDWAVTVYAYDSVGQQDTSTSGATGRYRIYPGDTAPTFNMDLLRPLADTVFAEGKILVSGRVEDNNAIASNGVGVAIVNAAGQYMSSTGTFTSTSESWRNAFLNSPGSPGSNYSFTTPTIPAGVYTVRVRGTDNNGFVSTPVDTANIVVSLPTSEPPVAAFTFACTPNPATEAPYCAFDGTTSTDENPTGLSYSWSFVGPTGTTSTASGAKIAKRAFTTAGTHTVTLTVRDEWLNSSVPVSQTVTIAEPDDNVAPVPVISTPNCTFLQCFFSSASSADPNMGDSVTRSWNFGDGTAANTSASPNKTFAAAGTYTVSLTTTDNWGKTATVTREVTVTAPPPPPVTP